MKPILSGILIAACCAPALFGAAPGPEALSFLQDDYAKALTAARAKKLPIFAEAWAPW